MSLLDLDGLRIAAVALLAADHPDIDYTREFSSIGEARKYFGIVQRADR